MKRITIILSVFVAAFLSAGCMPSIKHVIEEKVPELKKIEVGTHDLGEFKNGQSTAFRMLPAIKGTRCTVGFSPEPESRRFNIVLDDGRVFKVDDDNDLQNLSRVRLDQQSFYLVFRQDMRMIVIVYDPGKEKGL